MSADSRRLDVSRTEVFARLAEGLKAGTTVVTPNRRLALELTRDFDDAQTADGLTAWESADILPFSVFVERAYDDASHSDIAATLPLLLTPEQEQARWESVIRDSEPGTGLLAIPEAARLAREAWLLVQAWHLGPRLKHFPLNEDGKAFRDWAQRYERATQRETHTDGARLFELVGQLLGHAKIRTPKLLVCYGFDIVTPQQSALLDRLKAAGCKIVSSGPPPRQGRALRVACKDSRSEIRSAAAWARSQLEASQPRIGVVVPDLARHRAAIVRAFSAAMAPDYALPGTVQGVAPFNVSLGVPLSAYPLVHAAFLVLEFSIRKLEFEHASRLIRSPFLAGGEAEMACRARLDASLRTHAEPDVTLGRMLTWLARDGVNCPILAQRLSTLAEFNKAPLSGTQSPAACARRMSDVLGIVGFPGERSLDSTEYQTLRKWHQLLAAFAALDRVLPRIGYADAVSRLRRMATDTLFQPETPDVPIQILGVFEAAGMSFDRLWAMGLSDEAWPPAPRPNPFLPAEVQRAAGVPQSGAAESLELARRLTGKWLAAADEVVLSHPQREDDRELKPSPLISHIPGKSLALPEYPACRDAIHAAGRFEQVLDIKAPAIRTSVHRAGTAVIKDQAACPFRALALHRLGADTLARPHTGLDALERGTLTHRVLALTWAHLKNKDALDAIDRAQLDVLLGRAAEDAIARIRRDRPTTLSGRFGEIEKRRLVRLVGAWLDEEKKRGPFTVIAIEEKRLVEIGGLAFNARLDRVDQIPDGRRIVIDYKARAPSVGAMLGGRPDEPQLPLYLVASEPDAAAVAFAQVRAGDTRFAALARDGDLLPGVKGFADSRYRESHASWQEVIAAWRADLARLAGAFAAGSAEVDPKKYPHTCRYCGVKPLCRIHERVENVLVDDEDAA